MGLTLKQLLARTNETKDELARERSRLQEAEDAYWAAFGTEIERHPITNPYAVLRYRANAPYNQKT